MGPEYSTARAVEHGVSHPAHHPIKSTHHQATPTAMGQAVVAGKLRAGGRTPTMGNVFRWQATVGAKGYGHNHGTKGGVLSQRRITRTGAQGSVVGSVNVTGMVTTPAARVSSRRCGGSASHHAGSHAWQATTVEPVFVTRPINTQRTRRRRVAKVAAQGLNGWNPGK